MVVVILQGMSCVGKSTLGKQLEKHLPSCKHLALDSYKEALWDKHGFTSSKERESLASLARQYFYIDVKRLIETDACEYLLLDYVFHKRNWYELFRHIGKYNVALRTVYLEPVSSEEHEEAWKCRSRDFSVRHAGHGASVYSGGTGSNYENTYQSKIFEEMPTTEDAVKLGVSFNPYRLHVRFENLIEFIQTGTISY